MGREGSYDLPLFLRAACLAGSLYRAESVRDLKAQGSSCLWHGKTHSSAQGLESTQKAGDGEEHKQDIGRILVSDLG